MIKVLNVIIHACFTRCQVHAVCNKACLVISIQAQLQKIIQLLNFRSEAKTCVNRECLFESVYIATTAFMWVCVHAFLKLTETSYINDLF
jgi:hypothetical protein